jgi:outer membrane protein OmpA-like peptidoglycan-associated protein
MLRLLQAAGSVALLVAASPSLACIPVVDFDFGSVRLNRVAREEIAYRAGAVLAQPGARLMLTAITDAADRNRPLMVRRARAVRAEAIRQGVPARLISIRFERGSWQRGVFIDVVPPAGAASGTC